MISMPKGNMFSFVVQRQFWAFVLIVICTAPPYFWCLVFCQAKK